MQQVPYLQEANVHIYTGAIVQLDAAGYAVPAGAAYASAGQTVTVGVAYAESDNTIPGNTQGGMTVTVRPGVFLMNIGTSGDALAQANVGQTVYAIDDQTVGATYGTAAWGTTTHTGSGPAGSNVTPSGTPLMLAANERIQLDIVIVLGGAVATATFQWRFRGGQWSATTTTAASVNITDGIAIAFAAGTYVANDSYSNAYGGPRISAGKLIGIDASGLAQVLIGVPGIV